MLKPTLRKYAYRLLLATLLLLATGVLLHWLFPLPPLKPYSTIVLDNKGQVLHAFLTPDEKWRMKTELHEISPVLKQTLLYKEDKYFYYHPGINPFAIVRAGVMNLLRFKRTSGASTITMQVARMLQPKRRTYFNKAIEMFRALQLEWAYSKNEILLLYFNLVPYGSNIEGVKSAGILYFGKTPALLSLAEVTALSIIPNRPSSLKPGTYNEAIVVERNKWLKRFESDGLFTAADVADALNEPFNVQRRNAPNHIPHLALKLKGQQPTDIISTYINLQTQLKTEKLTADYVRGLKHLGIHNAAVVVIDNRTHRVVTYVGSADFTDATDGGQVNGAAAIRQPGSTLKPLVYGLCFDRGLLTPKTVITDVPVNLGGFQPENFDQKFNGYVTVEFALENSLNIPAVKALNELGTDALVAGLSQCGFKQIAADKKKLGLSVVLGGCGVTLEEMTGLFSAFANNGLYTPPAYFALPEKPLVPGQTSPKPQAPDTVRILTAPATFMITEILSRLARPDLPVNWEASMHTPRIAWKTGTSYGKRDAWSLGYNKNYTIGVWVGNFSGTGVPELNGANIATPLLFKIFNTIDYNSPNDWYSMPKECNLRLVCSETGKPPAEQCSHTVMDYFIPLISPATLCDNRKELAVDAKETISYCKNCQPETGYKKKWYRLTPPDMQSYFDDRHLAYEKVPPHNPECERVFTDGGPTIRFPVNGTEYLLDKDNPEPLQLSCETAADVKNVYWYVNNRFLKQGSAQAKLFFTPANGPVKISCTDDKGRNTDIWIKVRYVKI